jgi:hypothetical protein
VGEDSVDDLLILDHGNDLHGRAAARAEEGVNFINLADQPRPCCLSSTQAGPAESQGSSLSLPSGLIRRHRREQTARLADFG